MATRLQLFRGIASQLGELVTIQATSASTVATTFISASSQLTVPISAYNGREVWYVTGNGDSEVNEQTERRVVANSPTSTSLTVDLDWPALPQIGDVIDLVNWHGYSVRIQEIHTKINELIRRVGGETATVEAADEVAFDALAPTVTYPDTWDYIVGAQWQDFWGSWKPIFKRDLVFEPWDATVRIKGMPRRTIGTSNVRLIGEVLPPDLDQDDDETHLPEAWLIMQGAAELKRQAALRQGDAATALTISNMILPEAEKLKPQTVQDYDIVGGFRWSTRVTA